MGETENKAAIEKLVAGINAGDRSGRAEWVEKLEG
jgi:hypothetical protein